ncbi:family 78 glycoside hydrolase catalytic domain [uncultured Chitinophaga sp.]|uniref:family 78 glycoside hydrolase catalytic domain n=1 Tax=uncultured Chitinophaga sp. TaxID=339340 RepID=UPI0025D23BFA|nr:family 78 glycoside hydrolase catalytic domain [uncultured Chitinophaga sp.]
MKKWLRVYLLLQLLAFAAAAQQVTVTGLVCEYRENPLGVENRAPAFSWIIRASQNNVSQTAYRLLVADDPALLQRDQGNIWDTQKTSTALSQQIKYNGPALKPGKKYWWKVMVWDNKGKYSAWSKPAYWQMGLLSAQDWAGAKWIAHDVIEDTAIIAPHVHLGGKKAWGTRRNILPLFRKTFTLAKPVKSATAFISGLGHFEMSMNGRKTGDHFLDPGWTNYEREAQYVTFDITGQCKPGANAIGVMLGNGFYYIPSQRYRKMTGAYGLPKMIVRVDITYTDGTTENIISDESWRTTPSPIIFSSIFGGEDYDAALEQAGWNTASFDARNWKPVQVTTGIPLVSQMAEPVKVMERFKPIHIKEIIPGTRVYDLGQNFSGIPFIKVKGNKGDTVKITPAELVNEDGTANQKASGPPSYFTYILKGEGTETWHPRFSYYGFRYLEVQCMAADSTKARPSITLIEGLHTRNAAAKAGAFSSSNELFNKTYALIDWAIKSNTVSVYTDCPHREKLGWLEQTHLMGASVHFNYDAASLFRKVIRDMMNAQYEDGKVPEIAPEFTRFTAPFDESPEWGSAAIILPWYNYRWYGDLETLRQSYNMMKKYTGYLQKKSNGHILSHGLGDWFDIGPQKSGFSQMTKMGITATATYYYDLHIMAKTALLLDKEDEAKEYDVLAYQVKQAFNQQYFDRQKLQYDSASQTANAMALYMDLVEPGDRPAVVAALVKDIRSRNNALTAGDIGYRYVLRALEDAGRSDVIFDMNSRDDVPGYGYQLKHGATALTESWQAYPSVSNNHFMLGHLMEWFYAGLAGIGQDPSSTGYKHIAIKPEPVGDLKFVKARYRSPYGDIVSSWTKSPGKFQLKAEIPANTTATIYLPAAAAATIRQNGQSIHKAPENGRVAIPVGSGTYLFTVQE